MPQLRPEPWLWTLIIVWSAMLVMWTKLITFEPTNPPNLESHQTSHRTNPWTWPW